jgi:hypothetical protein
MKINLSKKFLYLSLLIGITSLYAQNEDSLKQAQKVDTLANDIAKSTNLLLPSNPAFVLLNINPAQVSKPGFVKDIKTDLVLKDGNIPSNLAVEIKPIWIYFFEIERFPYSSLTRLSKILSTTSLSLGTTTNNNQREFAWSLKWNLYRKDPLEDSIYLSNLRNILNMDDNESNYRKKVLSINFSTRKKIKELNAHKDSVNHEIFSLVNGENKTQLNKNIDSLNNEIRETDEKIEMVNKQRNSSDVAYATYILKLQQETNKNLKKLVDDYEKENWNHGALDIGIGQIFNYDSPNIDSLNFQSKGFGVWINASYSFGIKNVLASSLLKFININGKVNQFYGGNITCGSSTFTGFVEAYYEDNNSDKTFNIGYGGDYRIDNNKSIEFGIQTKYDTKFTFKNLIPKIKINWDFGTNPINVN